MDENRTEKTVIEYKPPAKQSNTLAGVATALGGVALLGVAGNAVGNAVSRYAGQIAANIGNITNTPVGIAPAVTHVSAPLAVETLTALNGRGFVTKEESGLIREVSAKDSVIAQLTAEKYADKVVREESDKIRSEMKSENDKIRSEMKAEVEPLKVRVCDLEKLAAVNAATDREYRRYAECAFVHQPKAFMRDRIVTCEPDKHCHSHNDCNCESW